MGSLGWLKLSNEHILGTISGRNVVCLELR